MTQNIINLNTNAAQPGINQEKVKTLPIIVPDATVLSLFTMTVEPLLALIFNLAKKNKILLNSRNLLLPKLILGEVDVSELDINISE